MAEDIAADIITKIIEKLGSAAFKKIKFAKDLDSHIERLREIKSIITTELHRCDPFEVSGDLEGQKIERLRRIHKQLVDFFEEQEIRSKQKEVLGDSTARLFFSSSNPLASTFCIAEKVKSITKELKSIADEYAQYSSLISHSSGNQNRCTLSEETSSLPDTSVLIGRDRDKENIVNMICNSSKDQVVAIVGVGGQGKTTLAQFVCQDKRVKGSFDKQLWVSLTPESHVNEILQKIIISATSEKPIFCGLEQLQLQVLQAIDGKKCLLVLDNVYYHRDMRDDSEELGAILERGCFWRNGGKVLITSRSKEVAEQMRTPKPYKLRELADDDCWMLLRHYAIKHEEDKKECGVEEIGKEIARMCPKMPLVLKTIGCHLADKDYKCQWEHFKNELASNPTLYIERQEKIKQILKICYDQLDHNLKRCVAFCSLFPKGHVYDKNYMVRYWIAFGYVESRDGMSLEDVGDGYVLELTQRAFFEGAGTFEFFKMHDVMHDLMLSIGKCKHQIIDSKTKNIVQGVCHVSLNMQDLNWDILLSSISGKKTLESIILVWSAWGDRVHGKRLASAIDMLIPMFPKLKVLEIYNQGIVKVPRSICGLEHLRHLNLSQNPLCKFPEEITKMVKLLSLNLSYCKNLEKLPRDLGKLVNLRHLWLEGCDRLTCMPKGIGNLRELETLDVFVVAESSRSKGVAKLEELGHLKNLKGSLQIAVAGESKNIVTEAGNANLEIEAKLWRLVISFKKKGEEDKRFLEGIQLYGENWECLYIRNYGGKRLPVWMTDGRFHKRFPKVQSFRLGSINFIPGVPAGFDRKGSLVFAIEGNEEDMGKWVPRYSTIKEHLKIGSIQLSFVTRRERITRFVTRREGITLTDVREDVCLFIRDELAPRSGCDCGGLRQPDFLLKSFFPNLTVLWLWFIPELEVIPEEFQDLSSLKYLSIGYCGKLKAIPDWIDTLSSLRSLEIGQAPEVKVLPDSIGSLTSLRALRLFDCTGLELLPHQISNLPMSCDLQISKCSKALYEKCAKTTGEYWPHLQHLRCIHIESSEGLPSQLRTHPFP